MGKLGQQDSEGGSPSGKHRWVGKSEQGASEQAGGTHKLDSTDGCASQDMEQVSEQVRGTHNLEGMLKVVPAVYVLPSLFPLLSNIISYWCLTTNDLSLLTLDLLDTISNSQFCSAHLPLVIYLRLQ